ncbi:hypothetical protein, conserved [Trypanosoma brucei gambiense DAL972]|uniref:Uncharacterized protein n=4 Tax=Trypanosoma brucei TaxID=5691 RepID=Q57Y16_TRYB2|nr:hypothetical protein, conserved [Trypanosoma brucei gambiense DAL972]XP_011776186.1 hypothetical protein, conserved [Trypanosoma brucei gambiense DAL972]XP_844562.1 hypothetical protein, conserved [Trypanosoma brucei brucei TREU927]AAX69518.1 hypothetical protein, conserved [Trypanosoma brucei]RHW71109.1 hypothetical protein DPX39_080056700 [Trypanosoma brucei equiperdum]AAX80108.1 hypothetical protein, unlikely [Trypanosoma brucei]AAZ11003.1 hypothetical protein, conserved [Trypanosoma br|eukprot:XP_011773014.1 hypothetical protein, conserved [Trypanosoma brucei gambiense DAL972]
MYFEEEENNDDYNKAEGDESPHSRASSNVSDMPMPPLPPPTPPADVYGLATEEIYSIIKELRRQIDDPTAHHDIKAMLKKEPSILLAVTRVLHESGLLRRGVVNAHGQVEEQIVPLPEAPAPPLPTGYSSWV